MSRYHIIGGSFFALLFGASLATVPLACAHAQTGSLVGDETFEGGFSCVRLDALLPNVVVQCQSNINPALPSFNFRLVGHRDDASGLDILHHIEMTRGGEATPFQTISPVNSSVPASVANYGFEAIDLNFDGYLDMRVISSPPVGANIPYKNWLWSTPKRKFVANPALDKITSPQFDANEQEITSQWRSNAAEHGTDVYAYDGDVPVLIHRETQTYGADGSCTRVYYDQIDDELRKNGKGPCARDE